jgi:hypothetical protein
MGVLAALAELFALGGDARNFGRWAGFAWRVSN